MPGTAQERGLADSFDHSEAIRHSALYLRDLRAELGSWELAAAAYNGGINRVKAWLANGSSLPFETEEYVHAITFRPADWFREKGRDLEARPLDPKRDFAEACRRLPAMSTRVVFAAVPPRKPAEAAGKRRQPGKASAEVATKNTPEKQVPAIGLPWGVQVAGHHDRAVAMKMYQRVQSSHPSILGGKEPAVTQKRTGRGLTYAVHINTASRTDADKLCATLRSAGGACAVFKN